MGLISSPQYPQGAGFLLILRNSSQVAKFRRVYLTCHADYHQGIS